MKKGDYSLNPALCWVGGKTKLKNKIIQQIPEHKTYLENFVGGGSVFFKKTLAEKNVINDTDTELIDFYRRLRDTSCNNLKKCNLPTNEAEFNKALEKKKQNACDFLKVNKRSYGCKMEVFCDSNVPKNNPKMGGILNLQKSCEQYREKLKKTKITNEDYQKSFKKHDSKNTFTYMDPPFVNSHTYHQEKVNPREVCKLAKSAKGKVMISYNDTPETRKECKGLKIKKVDVNYEIQKATTGERKKTKELLITNY